MGNLDKSVKDLKPECKAIPISMFIPLDEMLYVRKIDYTVVDGFWVMKSGGI